MKTKDRLDLLEEALTFAGFDTDRIISEYKADHQPKCEIDRPLSNFQAMEGVTNKGTAILKDWEGKEVILI